MSWDKQCTPVEIDAIERTWLMGGNAKVGFAVWGTYPEGSATSPEVTKFLMNCCKVTSGDLRDVSDGLNAGENRYTFIGTPASVLVLMSKTNEGDTDANKHGVVATLCTNYNPDTDVYMVYRMKPGFSARPYTGPISNHAARVQGAIKLMEQQQC